VWLFTGNKRLGLGLLGLFLALSLSGCLETRPFISAPPPPPPPAALPPVVARPTFYVTGGHVNLRACPGMDCPKISILNRNDQVEKVGDADDWAQVRVRSDGRLGWVSSRYLSATPVAEQPEMAPLPPPPAVVSPPPGPPPLPERVQPPPLPEKPPVAEKPKPSKPAPTEATPAVKKKAEEAKPAKPAKPPEAAQAAEEAPAPRKRPAVEKPAAPVEKPAPPAEKPKPAPEPGPEPGGKIRIM